MEAATPLRKASVRVVADRVAIENLVVADEATVRLVRGREEAGEDPADAVAGALEIGARVLDREQTGANAEFVRNEFEKASREVEQAFAERAGAVAEGLADQLEEVFGDEGGRLTKAFERYFSDDSSGAVQNRVKQLVAEMLAQARVDLLKQFTAADGQNPLADFKEGAVSAIRQAAEQQERNLQVMHAKLAEVEKELQGLRDERAKQEELTAEREKGTGKGRTYEEQVVDAVDAIARLQGDDCDALGDAKGTIDKKGDAVVEIGAAAGPGQGRIVFEAKDRALGKREALKELDGALENRSADFAVMVVPTAEELPAKTGQLREYGGNKLFVVFDPEDGSPLALEVAYQLAVARVRLARGDRDGGIDAVAVEEAAERAISALDEVRRIKQQLTGATTSIEKAREFVDLMAGNVRTEVEEIRRLAACGADAIAELPGLSAPSD
jgi:hypothetical protein